MRSLLDGSGLVDAGAAAHEAAGASIEMLEGRILLSHYPDGVDDHRDKFELADGRYRGYVRVESDPNGVLPEDEERLCFGKDNRLNFNLIIDNHEDGTVSGVIRAQEFVEEGGEIAFTGTQEQRKLKLEFDDNIYIDEYVGRVVPSGWYVHGEMRSDDNQEIAGWSRFRELRFANDHDDLEDNSKKDGKKDAKDKKGEDLFNSDKKITD